MIFDKGKRKKDEIPPSSEQFQIVFLSPIRESSKRVKMNE